MKIKKISTKGTKNIDTSKIEVRNYDYPIFCFKHLHKDFHINKCIDSLNCELPHSIKSTEDVKFLLAFRFDQMKPFVGFRNRFIFHVLFIDRDFTLYKH